MTRRLIRDAAAIFAVLSVPLLAATAAHFAAPSVDLGLSYPAGNGNARQALEILFNNARVAGLVAGATILAAAVPATARGLTWLLAAVAVLNLTLLGAVLLADGIQAAAAVLPHGTVELIAYSLGGAGFVHARERGPASHPGLLVATTAAVLALLGLAAAIEVNPS
jgi:hypothetical protein